MLRAGIVGLPNVGKSTLFNAVTRTRKAEAANYPFCTIDPNVGIVTVPDARLDDAAEDRQDQRRHPGGHRVRGHRRPGEGRAARAKGWATSSSPTSARWTPSCRWCAASRTRTFITSPGTRGSGARHRGHQHRADARRSRNGEEAAASKSPRTPSAATRRRMAEDAVLDEARTACSTPASPALTVELTPEEKRCRQAFFLLTDKPTIFACNVKESDLAHGRPAIPTCSRCANT